MSTGFFEGIKIESVKTYWDSRPCNLRHSPAPVGSREYFDQVEERKYFVEDHIPAFAEFAKWKDKKVLEVGCGIGTDTMNFARAGAQVTAVDLSSESLKLARQRASVYGLEDSISFYQGNAEDLTSVVPVDSYDLVYSFGVIHHTPQPGRVIEQIRNYMTPASELRLMLYSKVSYKLFWIMRDENVWDMGRMDELIAKNSEAQTGCPVTYTYTFDEVRDLLSGFEVKDIRKAHIFAWDLDAYKKYEYKRDEAWVNVTPQQQAILEKELGWHTLIRAGIAAGR